ncbi:flagellar hook-associated protein 2 [Sphingomonas gellani]|uniref:Flagellar hook-associated protein 2 n=1 Tax=Sphingomonas gellani TaxID=1166340 RepID=A0A1H8CI94_9SPHN|nr:flagellar filament capping protein FliD [Sphingomonas gellani]SEM94765.1 flagellar hook-associated protein 2 [Sphingomonas gellani]
MTTTTSATSSTSTANTTTTSKPASASTTAASSTSAATTQLLNSLNAGSGVDTASLVTSLVAAQFDAKTTQLTKQADTLTAQISGIATLKNALSTFSNALDTLTKNGTLVSQPVSGNNAVFTAAATGTGAASLSANLSVTQLASAQVAVSKKAFPNSTASVGTGQLTLTFGQAAYSADGKSVDGFTAGSAAPITIDITDGSLTKIAAAINAKKAGVTASVVTDADGSAYLSLKSATGKDQAFTLSSTSTTGDLSALNVGPGAGNSTITSGAQNAKMTLDGVAVERGSNTVSDLIDGVRLQLTGVSSGPVSLTSTVPADALKSAVTDFVDTYNQVLAMVDEQLDSTDGPLKNDQAVRSLKDSLQALTRRALSPSTTDGSPSTLAGIGVRTTKTGTLEVDDASLTRALKDYPERIQAMFASTTDGTGISAALKSVSLNAGSTLYGLGASNIRYLQQQKDLATQQDRLADQKTDATTRMTQQFSSMNSKVAAYKSTQTFLTNQIAAWNKSDN